MVKKISKKLILIYFLTLFVSEGLGINGGNRNIILYFYISFPLLLSIFIFLSKNKTKALILPLKLFSIYILFLVSQLISLFSSVDKEISFFLFLFNFSTFAIFIYFYNFKQLARNIVKFTTIISSFVFTFYFLLSYFYPPLKSIQKTGYQLTRTFFGYHNHLGDLLGMTIIYFLQNNNYMLPLLYLPFFLLSFSRSSYLALSLLLIYKKRFALPILIFIIGLILIILQNNTIVSKILTTFHQNPIYTTKDIFANRPEYLSQILLGFLERPVLGWGMGNFGTLSYKFRTQSNKWTEVAHNIFLEVLSEQGIIGLLLFSLLIFLILKNSEKHSLYFLLFLYLLINFQTDYTYKIYSLFFLFIILASIVYEEKNTIKLKSGSYLLLFISLLLALSVHQIVFSNILFLKNQPKLSLIFFPLNKNAAKIVNPNFALKISPYDKELLIYYAKNSGDPLEKLKYYKMLYESNPFENLEVLEKIYDLKLNPKSKEMAYKFLDKSLEKLEKTHPWELPKEERKFLVKLCQKDTQLCHKHKIPQFLYFQEPKPNSIEKSNPNLPVKADYTINSDGLNERFDYAINKPKETFRIMVLGGGDALGFLVNTKDNWTERLEDMLNKKPINKKYKHWEVINLAYHSHDLSYQVERFIIKGKKYQPDLVIWFNPPIYRFNEDFYEILEQVNSEITKQQRDKLQKEGNFFPDWSLAEKRYKEMIKKEKINVAEKQAKYLEEFFQTYKGKTLFISFWNQPEEIKNIIKKYDRKLIILNNLYDDKANLYKKLNILNPSAHKKIAREVYKILFNSLN